MPKKVTQDELDAVRKAVIACQGNASLEKITQVLSIALSRRTLQRRLAILVEQKQLARVGRGPRTYYRIPSVIAGPARIEGNGEVYVPLSSEGSIIKQAVRAPIQQRTPVGYQRAFLDAYCPNKTRYLTEEIRQRLMAIGSDRSEKALAGTYARKIFDRLLIDLSWNSSRLEGNTYSLLETERLLELGESVEGKDTLEAQMILNHKAAIELLVEQAEEVGFNPYTIQNIHALLSENLLVDPLACGRLRHIAVAVGGTVFHPLESPQLIDECFRQVLDTATAIDDPFEQAFFAMVHLPYLQPFEDVNKRVSRLAANIPLIRDNLCPLSFTDVPKQAYIDGMIGVYERNRVELLRDVFVWAYARSCARYSAVQQSLGVPDTFRLNHRDLIANRVVAVVRGGMNKQQAVACLRRCAEENIKSEDQPRFLEVVETELMSLHEGNIARYRLRLKEYRDWQRVWR